MTRLSLLFASALVCSSRVHEQPGPAKKTAAASPFIAPTDGAEPRAVAQRFVDASERRDFETAYQSLSSKLRERYTPARLMADFKAEPLAKERIERIRAALSRRSQ